MTTKKKLIRISGRGVQPTSSYGFGGMNFAFVSAPINGKRQQISSTTGCREYVNRIIWASEAGKTNGQYDSASDPKVDLSKLRLLLVHDPNDMDSFKQRLFNGKAALNVLEKINKWKPSVITTVKHEFYDNAWLLTGPAEWVSQPQLLSLATWVMRLTSFYGPFKVDDLDTLEKNVFNVINQEGVSDVGRFAGSFWDKMYIIVKYHKNIFDGMDLKTAWQPRNPANFGPYSGFSNFVAGTNMYSNPVVKAQARFSKLCKEHLPRKNKLMKRRN